MDSDELSDIADGPAGLKGYALSSNEEEARSYDSGSSSFVECPVTPSDYEAVSPEEADALLRSPREQIIKPLSPIPAPAPAVPATEERTDIQLPRKDIEMVQEEQMLIEEVKARSTIVMGRAGRLKKRISTAEKPTEKFQKGLDEAAKPQADVGEPQGMGDDSGQVLEVLPTADPVEPNSKDFPLDVDQAPKKIPTLAPRLAETDHESLIRKRFMVEWMGIRREMVPLTEDTLEPLAKDDAAAFNCWFRQHDISEHDKPRYLGVRKGSPSIMPTTKDNFLSYTLQQIQQPYSVFVDESRGLLKQELGPLESCRTLQNLDQVQDRAINARVKLAKMSDEVQERCEAYHDQFYANFNDAYECDWESYHSLRWELQKYIGNGQVLLAAKEELTPLQDILMSMCTYGYTARNILPPAVLGAMFRWSENFAAKLNVGATYNCWATTVRPPWITYGSCDYAGRGRLFFLVLCSNMQGTSATYKVRLFLPKLLLAPYVASMILPLIPGSAVVERIEANISEYSCFRAVIASAIGVSLSVEDIQDPKLLGRLLKYVEPWPDPMCPRRKYPTKEEMMYKGATRSSTVSYSAIADVHFYMPRRLADEWIQNTVEIFNIDRREARKLVETPQADCLLSFVSDDIYSETSDAVLVCYGADLTSWELGLGYIHRNFSVIFEKDVRMLSYAFGLYHESSNGEGGQICEIPLMTRVGVRTEGSWFMYFFGFNNTDFITPANFNGQLFSEMMLSAKHLWRPCTAGMMRTCLEMRHLNVKLANTLRGMKAIGFVGPSKFMVPMHGRFKPKTRVDGITQCFRETAPGVPYDVCVSSMPTEFQNHCLITRGMETAFEALTQVADLPPPELHPKPLPAHLLTPDQLNLLVWVADLKKNPHHNGDGRGLFLQGHTAAGKTSFVQWLMHYFHCTILTTSGQQFYQGVKPTDEVLVFDDIDEIGGFPDILKLLDAGKNVGVNVKFGQCVFKQTPRLVFVTNKTFEEYFFKKDVSLDTREALRRKITQVKMTSDTNTYNHVKFRYRDCDYTGTVVTHSGIPAGLRWYTAPMKKTDPVPDVSYLIDAIENAPKRKPATLGYNYSSMRTDLGMIMCPELPAEILIGEDLEDVYWYADKAPDVVPEKAIAERVLLKIQKLHMLDGQDIAFLLKLIPNSTTTTLIQFYNSRKDSVGRMGILHALTSRIRELD